MSSPYQELREQAQFYREEVTAFVQRLVRTPSFSFREEAVAGLVQEALEGLQYDLVFRDEVGNVVALLAGSEDGPTVLLNAHLDTWRPEDDRGWREGLFSGRVEGGRVWGLGAAKCKGGLAAQIFAGHILDKSLFPFYGTLVFAATVAQEGGNGVGVRYLLDETLPKLGVMPNLAILGEPTALEVRNGHDGRADVDIRVTSANLQAVREVTAAVHAALARACEHFLSKGTRPSLRVSDPVFGERDGVPEAALGVRCRVTPSEAVTNCVGLVKRLCASAVEGVEDVSVEAHVHSERRRLYTGKSVEVLCWSNPWLSDPTEPMFRRALGALTGAGWKDVTVRAWGLERLRLGTAGSLLADSHRIPTFGFGPGDEDLVYTPEESVEIERIVGAVFGTAVLVHGAIGTPYSMVWPTNRTSRSPVRGSTK